MSLLCVHHSVSPSHLFICIATLSPSLKHRVSSHHSPSHLPPYLPPPPPPLPSPPLPSSPMLSTSTQPSLTLSAVRSKYQDTGYLTRPRPGSSASSEVLLADWQRIIFPQTSTHTWTCSVWLTEAWLMCSYSHPSYSSVSLIWFIPISSLLFFSLPISLLSVKLHKWNIIRRNKVRNVCVHLQRNTRDFTCYWER